MSITQEEAELYLNKRVELLWNGLKLIGIVKLVTSNNISIDHPEFGISTKPLLECDGIREDKEVN